MNARVKAALPAMVFLGTQIAGCGGSQPPIGAPGAVSQAVDDASSSSFRVLHRFGRTYGGGVDPRSALLDVNGTLYGTTVETRPCHRGSCGYGTVFSVSATGLKTTLYRFKGGASDGAYPDAPLIDVDGTLYGTTASGGGSGCGDGCGTVFSVSTGGSEKVLYSFQGASDGWDPAGGLIEVDGTLYGTTSSGGAYVNCGSGYASGCGTVYSISLSGSERVLHAFTGIPDAAEPTTPLTDVNGTLYGVTLQGGVACGNSTVSFPDGCGTVYSITTSGAETVLHRFKGQADGKFPTGGLLEIDGTLYGTTGALAYDRGSVYKISTDGTVTTLYRFQALPDATFPNGGLIDVNGTLYGTTSEGGTACTTTGVFGCGTVFSVTTSGKEAVLHRFAGKSSGLAPMAGLTYLNGRLYGTTPFGGYVGSGRCYLGLGCGIIFALTP